MTLLGGPGRYLCCTPRGLLKRYFRVLPALDHNHALAALQPGLSSFQCFLSQEKSAFSHCVWICFECGLLLAFARSITPCSLVWVSCCCSSPFRSVQKASFIQASTGLAFPGLRRDPLNHPFVSALSFFYLLFSMQGAFMGYLVKNTKQAKAKVISRFISLGSNPVICPVRCSHETRLRYTVRCAHRQGLISCLLSICYFS